MIEEKKELHFNNKPIKDMTRDELIEALLESARIIANRDRRIEEYYNRLSRGGPYERISK